MRLRRQKHRWLAPVFCVLLVSCRGHVEPTQSSISDTQLAEQLQRAAKHLVELDVDAARVALDSVTERRVDVDLLRARLALALGDCQGAVTVLATHAGAAAAAPASAASDQSGILEELHAVANGCARAMAGATILVDERRGVWVRFQNSHDQVLMPLIADVADRAAKVIGSHLGTALPRPLRIELVADLASLATVTGLPLEAAETTGTIAIARWGKVTLVSPRATPEGYPWQDTLAHELTHLLVARRSDDSAPLWLQEGIAKREETRWRNSMPLDAADDPHREARQALLEGRSIGVDHLGASIALLPTPKAAETAYAEVRDFLDYWLKNNGEAALVLLLHDLAGLGGGAADRAMVSVSGYSLNQWSQRWQHSLLEEARSAAPASGREVDSDRLELTWGVDMARRMRLSELLMERRHVAAVAKQLEPLATLPTMPPELAYQLAMAQVLLGQPEAAHRFVDPELVSQLDGTWLAVRGRVLASTGEAMAAEVAFLQSLAFAPTLEKVACRGFSNEENAPSAPPIAVPPVEPWLTLCRAVLALQSQ